MVGCKEFWGDFVVVGWTVLLMIVCHLHSKFIDVLYNDDSLADTMSNHHHQQLAAATRGRSLVRSRVGI